MDACQSLRGQQYLVLTIICSNYVNQSTALQECLVSFTMDSFKMGADHTTVLDPDGPGRNSVRIRSNDVYSTHVAIFNINHMPQVRVLLVVGR